MRSGFILMHKKLYTTTPQYVFPILKTATFCLLLQKLLVKIVEVKDFDFNILKILNKITE